MVFVCFCFFLLYYMPTLEASGTKKAVHWNSRGIDLFINGEGCVDMSCHFWYLCVVCYTTKEYLNHKMWRAISIQKYLNHWMGCAISIKECMNCWMGCAILIQEYLNHEMWCIISFQECTFLFWTNPGQHLTRQQLNRHLPPISQAIKVKRTGHARPKGSVCRPVKTYIHSSVQISNAVWRTSQERWRIGTDGERESRNPCYQYHLMMIMKTDGISFRFYPAQDIIRCHSWILNIQNI